MHGIESNSTDLPFFRPEASSASHPARLGRVLIHQPIGFTVSAILALTLITISTAFFYFGTYTRKETATGLLMPEQGMLRLSSNGAGFISETRVTEGQHVDPGDILFIVSNETVSTIGGTQKLISEQLQKRLSLLEHNRTLAIERAASQSRMLNSRLQTIDEELSQLREEFNLLGRRIELSQVNIRRQNELASEGFISIAKLQQAEGELLTLQGQHQTLHRTQSNLLREKIELSAHGEESKLKYLEDVSDIENTIAIVRQEQAENDVRTEQIITAPFQGTITGVSVQPGQQIVLGTLLASLIPHDAKLTAHVYVSPRQSGFIKPGQTALMRYAAYPYQKFGSARGRVLTFAKTPYAVQELPPHVSGALQSRTNTDDLFYRVTLELESQSLLVHGTNQPLRAGMLLEADIIQENRRLYEWVLEPIYSVIGKLDH
ncbi:HlyD family secretion protein [Metapseudomonas furukawaii]|uniref:HlyD family secretion protein n=1 Tax=Metapseudomonas furukawaii TaxID=1149133 RepID=UPI0040454F8A